MYFYKNFSALNKSGTKFRFNIFAIIITIMCIGALVSLVNMYIFLRKPTQYSDFFNLRHTKFNFFNKKYCIEIFWIVLKILRIVFGSVFLSEILLIFLKTFFWLKQRKHIEIFFFHFFQKSLPYYFNYFKKFFVFSNNTNENTFYNTAEYFRGEYFREVASVKNRVPIFPRFLKKIFPLFFRKFLYELDSYLWDIMLPCAIIHFFGLFWYLWALVFSREELPQNFRFFEEFVMGNRYFSRMDRLILLFIFKIFFKTKIANQLDFTTLTSKEKLLLFLNIITGRSHKGRVMIPFLSAYYLILQTSLQYAQILAEGGARSLRGEERYLSSCFYAIKNIFINVSLAYPEVAAFNLSPMAYYIFCRFTIFVVFKPRALFNLLLTS